MNNGTFINQSSQYNDYKKLIYDFSPSKFKKQYDEDFYFDDNKNISNNVIYSPINEFTTIKEYLKHRSDIIENLGYDYQNNGILNNIYASGNALLLEELRDLMVVEEMVDQVVYQPEELVELLVRRLTMEEVLLMLEDWLV